MVESTQSTLPFASKKRTAQQAGIAHPEVAIKRQKAPGKDLHTLIKTYGMADFKALFAEMSEQYLNHTLMYTRSPSGKEQYFRVCEIEFYLNCPGHTDTFAHGDVLQKQNAKWYFHKMGNAYKAGSYKGLDITFGKEGAIGGILLRALMPVSVVLSNGVYSVSGGSKDLFIEGPCNCVNRILEETTGDKGIKELVDMKEFSLEAFDPKSNFHLICAGVQMPQREIVSNPRVGLTLNKLDEHKPGFWLADYRFVSHPELHQKMKDFIILAMIAQSTAIATIAAKANCKVAKVEEMKREFEKGQSLDSTMVKVHDKNMKAADWGVAYGLCKKLYK